MTQISQPEACKGTNCTATDGISHSPECKAEHDAICAAAALADAKPCSVPMWSMGMPAGFCGRPAFGPRPPCRMLRDAWTGRQYREDGKYDGYVPGLACDIHGGPES